MAGYDLMEAGRSPAEIRRLKARRARMRKNTAKKAGKPTTTTTTTTTTEKVTAQGRRDNARAQRVAEEARAKDRAKAKAKAKADATKPTKPTITNPRGTMRGRKFFPKPDSDGTAPSVKALKKYTTREAARRKAETARLNKEHNDKKARRGLPKPGTFARTMEKANQSQAEKRRAERDRLNKEYKEKKTAEKGKEKPWWRFGLHKGGVVGPQPGPQARTARPQASKAQQIAGLRGIGAGRPSPTQPAARPQPSKAQQIAGLRGIGAGRPSPTQPAARPQARDTRQDARRQARDTRQDARRQARTARQDARQQARQPAQAMTGFGLRRPAPKPTARPTARPAGLRKFKTGGVVRGGAKSINGIAKRGLTRAPQAKT